MNHNGRALSGISSITNDIGEARCSQPGPGLPSTRGVEEEKETVFMNESINLARHSNMVGFKVTR